MISAVVGIHYYTFTDNYLLTFLSNEESSHKEKIITNDIQLAVAANLLAR